MPPKKKVKKPPVKQKQKQTQSQNLMRMNYVQQLQILIFMKKIISQMPLYQSN